VLLFSVILGSEAPPESDGMMRQIPDRQECLSHQSQRAQQVAPLQPATSPFYSPFTFFPNASRVNIVKPMFDVGFAVH
jgi:hypothetical protein